MPPKLWVAAAGQGDLVFARGAIPEKPMQHNRSSRYHQGRPLSIHPPLRPTAHGSSEVYSIASKSFWFPLAPSPLRGGLGRGWNPVTRFIHPSLTLLLEGREPDGMIDSCPPIVRASSSKAIRLSATCVQRLCRAAPSPTNNKAFKSDNLSRRHVVATMNKPLKHNNLQRFHAYLSPKTRYATVATPDGATRTKRHPQPQTSKRLTANPDLTVAKNRLRDTRRQRQHARQL